MIKKTIYGSFLLIWFSVISSVDNKSDVKLIAIPVTSEDQIDVIYQLGIKYGVFFWSVADTKDELFAAFIDAEEKKGFLKALDFNKFKYEMSSTDPLRQKLKKMVAGQPSGRAPTPFDYFKYHNWGALYLEMDRIAADHVNTMMTAKVETIGTTQEGKRIKGMRIGRRRNEDDSGDFLNIIVLECGIHGREWSSVAFCMWTINHLLNEPLDMGIVVAYEFIIIPVLNVDGYDFTWLRWNDTLREEMVDEPGFSGVSLFTSRFHRKNMQKVANPDDVYVPKYIPKKDENDNDEVWDEAKGYYADSVFCVGTDLNRNFETDSWCTKMTGSSMKRLHPCGLIYCGEKPFSAPETRALRDFLIPLKDRIVGYFSIHAYSGLWMYPKSYKAPPVPEIEELKIVSKAAVDAIKAVNGIQFKSGTGPEIMYSSEGDSAEWAYEKLNVEYSFSIEVRPIRKNVRDFGWNFTAVAIYDYEAMLLEPAQIEPMAKETWAGVKAALLNMWTLSDTYEKDNEAAVESGISGKGEKADNLSTQVMASIITIIVIVFCVTYLSYI